VLLSISREIAVIIHKETTFSCYSNSFQLARRQNWVNFA